MSLLFFFLHYFTVKISLQQGAYVDPPSISKAHTHFLFAFFVIFFFWLMRATSRSRVASPQQISPSSAVYSSGCPRGLLQFPPCDPGWGQSHFGFYGATKQQLASYLDNNRGKHPDWKCFTWVCLRRSNLAKTERLWEVLLQRVTVLVCRRPDLYWKSDEKKKSNIQRCCAGALGCIQSKHGRNLILN